MGDRFFVSTWDYEREEFTPQRGVKAGPYSKWGLRKALRKLKALGYDIAPRRNANSVYVVNRKGCGRLGLEGPQNPSPAIKAIMTVSQL